MTTSSELAEIIAAVRADLEAAPLEGVIVEPRVLGGFYQVAPGQTILSDHMNTALINGVPKFPNAGERDRQWPKASVPVGAMCYLIDVNYFQVFDNQITGGANDWHVLGGLRMGYGLMGNAQAIPTGVQTLVKLTTKGGAAGKAGRSEWNADGSVTAPIAGTYLVSGTVNWPSNATGERRLYIMKKTVAGNWVTDGVAGGMTEDVASGAGAMYQSASAEVLCSVGEMVGMRVYQTSGVSLTLVTNYNRLGVHLLGAE